MLPISQPGFVQVPCLELEVARAHNSQSVVSSLLVRILGACDCLFDVENARGRNPEKTEVIHCVNDLDAVPEWRIGDVRSLAKNLCSYRR